MAGGTRATKRRMLDEDQEEVFWTPSKEEEGAFLMVHLKSGRELRKKGWPWLQLCLRNVLGENNKVERVSLMRDGGMLIKTATKKQTEKFLRAKYFDSEEADIVLHPTLNQSKGTIYSYDMLELEEREICEWLKEYGVTEVKRVTKKVDGQEKHTPLLILTFNSPKAPESIKLDYVKYNVRKYVPRPLMCYTCGEYGHGSRACKGRETCLKCGEEKHVGRECDMKCLHCGSTSHSCGNRVCEKWVEENEICKVKADRGVSFFQAKKIWETEKKRAGVANVTGGTVTFATATQKPSHNNQKLTELEGKVEKLTDLVSALIDKINQLIQNPNPKASTSRPTNTGPVKPATSAKDLHEAPHQTETHEQSGMDERNSEVDSETDDLIEIVHEDKESEDESLSQVSVVLPGRARGNNKVPQDGKGRGSTDGSVAWAGRNMTRAVDAPDSLNQQHQKHKQGTK